MVGYNEDRKAYNREKYREYRRRNMLVLTGGKEPRCNQCGSDKDLEFDHVDPGQKIFNMNTRKSLKKEDYLEELMKCQILCKECHEQKTAKENEGYTHGSLYAFQKAKCDCEICTQAEIEYKVRRNASRRVDGGRGPYNAEAPCGTYKSYNRGCKCTLCKKANSDQTKVYRERAKMK